MTDFETLRRIAQAKKDEATRAKLIAAAPELLLALERIANMTDRNGNQVEMHLDELRGIARAAISQVNS